MTIWIAIALGLIQGLTEFLPVSSSGHLTFAELVFGFSSQHHFTCRNASFTSHSNAKTNLVAYHSPTRQICSNAVCKQHHNSYCGNICRQTNWRRRQPHNFSIWFCHDCNTTNNCSNYYKKKNI